ncbi:MAG: hypothetical protein K2Y42_19655 [Hyphomicrobium sp.]|jgi:hypothetical protein|uniref:DUF6629 family protein n=1 Tax=Hyphomicrobium sp. TaxID=82 RepID=UPI0025C49366|nr:DUF6629 family protein [Hyphomicrobium sp.]MBX9864964.1 hypothetical protein [Hyphomicrobium sp.]
MCFSAEASYTAAAVLLPAGGFAIQRAYHTNQNYLPIAALPLFFGLQQLFEGLVWTGNAISSDSMVQRYSLAYMFFSWLAWPVWVPFSTYFLEPCRRRYIYLIFAIMGGMLGAMQYFPYFAHDGWLVTKFFPNAISYQGAVLFDYIVRREFTYAIYLFVIIVPLLSSSDRHAQLFGVLIAIVVAITYLFFKFAYISVFCFGGALMSLYVVYMVLDEPGPARDTETVH